MTNIVGSNCDVSAEDIVSSSPRTLSARLSERFPRVSLHRGRVRPALVLMTFSPQPDDRGTINDISVLRVTRRGAQADHFTLTALSPGSQVQVRVDWERRFDHMQQHSGKGHGPAGEAQGGTAVSW